MRFLDCTLDVAAREMRRGGDPVQMEPQVFDVLTHLVANRDRMVTKSELLDAVWGTRFVSESALTSRVKSARRAVGDTGRDQRVIKTIHGRGYRFVAPVEQGPGVEAPGARGDLAERTAAALSGGRGIEGTIAGTHGPERSAALERIHASADGAGALVGRGSSAGAGMRAFGCVIDALDELLHREEGILEGLSSGVRDEISRCVAGEPPSTRQRLFLAVREVLVAAASRRPTLVVLDDLEFADTDTIALIRHMARLVPHHPLGVIVAHPPDQDVLPGSVRAETGDSAVSADAEADLPPDVRDALRAVALAGPTFDTMEFRAAAGVEPAPADRLLDLAVRAGVLQPVPGGGYRFADDAQAERLTRDLRPHQREEIHRATAARLRDASASAARVAEHLLHGGEPAAAVSFALDAARTAADAQLHGDVLRWTAAVAEHASGWERLELLVLQGASMVATGDPAAVRVYREALGIAPAEARGGLRAGLARAAMVSGDFATAADALDGLEPDGGMHDGPILLAKGMFAFFSGELDTAQMAADAARGIALSPGAPARLLDVITLQGMIAHNRGEWIDRLRSEKRTARGSPELVSTIFDCHLCVAEYLLYGPMPYAEVVALAHDLRDSAERSGATRAVAFAICVSGEAELLAGNLDAARHDLVRSVQMHRDLAAETGTAHSLQRLAELELASGNRQKAERLLREALPLARWSPLARHLVQRTFGTLIQAAPDPAAAVALVEEADDVLDDPSSCVFCQVMVAVPSAIACATVGRLDEARQHLVLARMSAAQWQGTAWQGAVAEAAAVIARQEGDGARAADLLREATSLFAQAGQPIDVARCNEAMGDFDGH